MGDGWQLWETTSEGSPQSPVFATADELAEWAAHNATVFASVTATKAEWLKSFNAGDNRDVDSLLVQTGNQPATMTERCNVPGCDRTTPCSTARSGWCGLADLLPRENPREEEL